MTSISPKARKPKKAPAPTPERGPAPPTNRRVRNKPVERAPEAPGRSITRADDEKRWPATHSEMRPVVELKPFDRNPRTHSESQIAKLMESIKEWGFTIPLLVDESGELIAGHARLEAAKRLGHPRVPVMVARGWTEAQRHAYVIADNQLALLGGWDADMLSGLVQDLAATDYSLMLLGFSDADLQKLTSPEGQDGEDDLAPIPPDPVTQKGDLITLGRHRLLCGDSTIAANVELLLEGKRPHLMVTDPPYGVEYEADWRPKALKDGYQYATGRVRNDDRCDWREAWALFPGDVAYVWHSGLHAAMVAESLAAHDFGLRCQIIWAKPAPVLSRGNYHWQHEPCLYVVRKSGKAHWIGDRTQTSIWNVDHRKSDSGHSTQKPVEVMRRPLLNNSKPGDAIYDPFGGSGTTLVACELTERTCYMVELEPGYCDAIVERWEKLTGQRAVREHHPPPPEATRGRTEAAAEAAH